MDLTALVVGALSGAFFTALFTYMIEKWRAGEGYREKVYERVVEAILEVHETFVALEGSFGSSVREPEREDEVYLWKKYDELYKVLTKHSLYYPRDLRKALLDVAGSMCNILDKSFSLDQTNKYLDVYLKSASKKIDFRGSILLNLGYRGTDPVTIRRRMEERY